MSLKKLNFVKHGHTLLKFLPKKIKFVLLEIAHQSYQG